MKSKTFLVLGDEKDFDTYCKIVGNKRFFRNSKFILKGVDYFSILKNKMPVIDTKEIIIFPCFPFEYWDKYIEPKDYTGVYGPKAFYTKFVLFWEGINKKLKKQYKNNKLIFINDLTKLALDRDKEKVKNLVARKGVSISKNYRTRNLKEILRLLDKGEKLFVKVRYGSMGKGITYLEKGNWKTNFSFKHGKILSRKSDYGWKFRNCTDNFKFLKELLKQEIIIEEAIDPLLIKKRKFDLRIYVYKKKITYIYGRSTEKDNVTTNISQGARGESVSFASKLPRKQLNIAKQNAIKSIKALGLNFGGVDLMFCSDKKSVKFIEVNTFPGFPKVKRYNLAKFLINEIIKDYK